MKKYWFILFTGLMLLGCSQKEPARNPVSRASGSFLKKSIEISKKVVSEEETLFDSLMKANPQNEYLTSEKGYWYCFINKSDTEDYLPQPGDLVYFDSEITNIEGDSIYKKGELKSREYMVDKEDIIIGLRDGIKRMKKGEKVQFLFPSHVAYGYIGDKKRIGMNEPIIYTVTLNDIHKAVKKSETN